MDVLNLLDKYIALLAEYRANEAAKVSNYGTRLEEVLKAIEQKLTSTLQAEEEE